MSRPQVRTDTEDPGQGEWIDQKGSADGSAHVRIVDNGIDWQDDETLTVSTAALQISAPLRNYERAIITVESQSARYWISGHTPTASVGIEVGAGDIIHLDSKFEVEKFRVIRKDGSDSTLRVTVGNRG